MADSAPRIFLPAQDADPGLPLPPLAPAAPAPAKISRITEMKRKIVEQSNARVKAVCANGLGWYVYRAEGGMQQEHDNSIEV